MVCGISFLPRIDASADSLPSEILGAEHAAFETAVARIRASLRDADPLPAATLVLPNGDVHVLSTCDALLAMLAAACGSEAQSTLNDLDTEFSKMFRHGPLVEEAFVVGTTLFCNVAAVGKPAVLVRANGDMDANLERLLLLLEFQVGFYRGKLVQSSTSDAARAKIRLGSIHGCFGGPSNPHKATEFAVMAKRFGCSVVVRSNKGIETRYRNGYVLL